MSYHCAYRLTPLIGSLLPTFLELSLPPQKMPGPTTTNTPQPPDSPSGRSPFSFNPLAISISQENRNRQSNGFQNIDDIKPLTSPRRSNTFPQHQGSGNSLLAGTPEVASTATPTPLHLNSYGHNVTVVTPDYGSGRITGTVNILTTWTSALTNSQ